MQKGEFSYCPADLEAIVDQGGAAQGKNVQVSRGGGLLKTAPPAVTRGLKMRLSFRLWANPPNVNCKGKLINGVADEGKGVAATDVSAYYKDLITRHLEKKP